MNNDHVFQMIDAFHQQLARHRHGFADEFDGVHPSP
jgi:hypothetical protein